MDTPFADRLCFHVCGAPDTLYHLLAECPRLIHLQKPILSYWKKMKLSSEDENQTIYRILDEKNPKIIQEVANILLTILRVNHLYLSPISAKQQSL